MVNNGKDYEQFVGKLHMALMYSEKIAKQKNIEIEFNRKILDKHGIEREFDIYWEYELAGIVHKTVIECKDYNSKISIDKIDALIGKSTGFPDIMFVFATRTGYQSGAIKRARANNIELLVVREQLEKDWVDHLENPCIKAISVNLMITHPALINYFNVEIDRHWAIERGEKIDNHFKIAMKNDQAYIENLDSNEKYSLRQLAQDLGEESGSNHSKHTKTEHFGNGYICFDDVRLKLISYTVGYTIRKPEDIMFEYDFGRELQGVIEYLNKKTKTAIFSHKVVKAW
jgi:hypothetical protein